VVNLTQGKELPLPIEWETRWAQELSRHLGMEKSLAAAGI